MTKKFQNNKLEQNRGLLLQVSIIISLLIVLAAFNFKSKSKSKFSGDFAEINLQIDSIGIKTNDINKPVPVTTHKNAEFTGGKDALFQYIKTNLKYPEAAKTKHIQGRVYVKFTVNRYGKIKNVKIVRSIHPLLDKEALRLIKNMPDWQPAKTKIGTFDSEHVLPVIFMKKNFTF
ncbi:MAG: hypothetical protein DRI94_00295 [Bacteroidetes bacterium]|nr:MAG: hypothetical protein DRI94_00295 [Bacteroidota bacterium]